MALGMEHPITEICLLVKDIDRSIEFYEKLGFKMQRRGEKFCFANFDAKGIKLAVWESDYVAEHVGLEEMDSSRPIHKVIAAFQVEGSDTVDSIYEELTGNGVSIISPPRIYDAWNSYCFYFSDPDGNAWEVYSWGDGGADHSWPRIVE